MYIPNVVACLLIFLLSCPESETATTAFTTKPPNPRIVEEGKSFTLEWTYTLDGTVVIAQFYNATGGGSVLIGKTIGTGNISVESDYQGRSSGQVTNTKAELTVVGMQRSELLTCRFVLTPTISGSLTNDVEIIVHYSSSITGLSGENATVEGGNVTLECRAVGNPKPNITWARLPDNCDVAMPLTNITEQDAGMCYNCPLTQSCTLPLTNISRHDAGMFRCTADNGVGSPATGDVLLVVQFEPENAFLSTNLSTVPVVCAGMVANFTCTVEASNPAVDTFILYENGSMVSSKTDLGVWIKTVDTSGEVTYECQANNSVGTSSSRSISFTVGVRASAAVESNSIVVTEGQDVNLVCSESGFPSPNTLWINVSNVVMDNGRILSLYNISRTMAAQYTCSARNSCGNDSQKVDLVVQYPPEVNGSGRNATVAAGAEHTFSCPVDGKPAPNITWYHVSVSREAYRGKHFTTSQRGCYICVARNVHGTSDNITQCLFINSSLPTVAPNTGQSQTIVSSITVSQTTSQIMVSSTTASQGPSSSSATPPKAGLRWIIIIVVVGGVVLLAVLVGVLTWWVHKQRKCRKDTKIHNSDLGRHDDQGGHSQVPGAYAQSGPPAANGPDGAAEQEIEVAGSIPTYAVVNKSKKSKKQADEKPPKYAVVDKSKKKEEQEAAAIPTYAAVDKSKKKKKSREEVPPVYAEVDKSKKKKKKKIDDKNLYENLDEPKKEKKPGELLYADLGDFQNPSMPAVSTSPQPLPAIKKADPYERTDYADITQFLKGNATLPPNDGNGDTEMKPKRPSKKKEIQGNDKETPI